MWSSCAQPPLQDCGCCQHPVARKGHQLSSRSSAQLHHLQELALRILPQFPGHLLIDYNQLVKGRRVMGSILVYSPCMTPFPFMVSLSCSMHSAWSKTSHSAPQPLHQLSSLQSTLDFCSCTSSLHWKQHARRLWSSLHFLEIFPAFLPKAWQAPTSITPPGRRRKKRKRGKACNC